jgi:hypothetical protein
MLKKTNLKKSALLFLSLTVITACQTITQSNEPGLSGINNTNPENINTAISGFAEFPRPDKFKTKATVAEVTSIATVSVLNAVTKTVMATGITDEKGAFTITPGKTFNPSVKETFIVEAAKRTGNKNDVIALRTYIQWNGGKWVSITTPNVVLNSKTTALSIIAGENPSISPGQLINRISITGENSTFTPFGPVTAEILTDVDQTVNSLLSQSYDPVQYIRLVNGEYTVIKQVPPYITRPIGPDKIFSVGNSGTGTNIYAMDLDGTHRVNLTQNLTTPVNPISLLLSPDRRNLFFASSGDGGGFGGFGPPTTFSMPVDGSDLINLTKYSVHLNESATFLPNGKILYRGSLTGSGGCCPYGGFDVFTVNPDGSGLTNISNNNSVPMDSSLESFTTPDKSKVFYGNDGANEIYMANTSGPPAPFKLSGNFAVRASSFVLSPDGKRIAFTAADASAIYLTDTNGSGNIKTINAGTLGISPSGNIFEGLVFSGDSTKLTFQVRGGASGDNVFVITNLDTLANFKAVSNIANAGNYSPLFSRDNSRVIWRTESGSPLRTMTLPSMKADGSGSAITLLAVTSNPGQGGIGVSPSSFSNSAPVIIANVSCFYICDISETHIISADGTSTTLLPNSVHVSENFTGVPGNRIIFSTDSENGTADIFSLKTDGTDYRNLTNTDDVYEFRYYKF